MFRTILLSLVACGLFAGEVQTEPTFLRRNIADVVAILNNTAANCPDARDANDDGDIANIAADSSYLLSFLFSAGPPPVHPYPNCGNDEFTYDDRDCLDSLDPCP